MCHYLWPNGRSGTGKGSMLETAHQLAYRAVMVSNTTAANVYCLLEPVERLFIAYMQPPLAFIELCSTIGVDPKKYLE